MSYAADLLDGFEILYRRTEGVAKVSFEMADFFKRLSEAELEYSKMLSKISKSFGAKKLIGNPFVDGSLKDAWVTVLGQLDALAAHHLTLSTQLDKDFNVVGEKFFKDKDAHRKKLTADGQKLTRDWKGQQDVLARSKSNYMKLSKEAEAAHASHRKAAADPKLKPDKIMEYEKKARAATDKANISDQEYKDMLNTTNNRQNDLYTVDMPNLLTEFQRFEEERVTFVKETLGTFSQRLAEVPPAVQNVSDQVGQASHNVDPAKDIVDFCANNKTGVTPPPAVDYEVYVWSDPSLQAGASSSGAGGYTPSAPTPSSSSPAQMKMGTYKPPPATSNKQWGLTPADQSLSVDQKISKLEGQLNELQGTIHSETQARAGIEKLVQFYAKDPVAAKKAEAELHEADRKLRALQDSEGLVSGQLSELQGGHAAAEPAGSEPRPVRVRGLYDYAATCDTELSFQEGDVLTVTEQDESGWWFAELNSASGFVPQNYVEVIE
eukprot:TRINITY_DN2454_c0_g1_i1.p1 TRINITY_DN2454_c0_g1~~TRINITY_DN2454_c0_g1_i1.p1  ORF type:complete len:493 (+),score=140.17 TRINITY_DN2454_c0_g1_i1:115-1593(+)